MKSWKTTLMGVGILVLTVAGPVLEAYYPLRGMNWIVFSSSLSAVLTGGGLMLAKDRDVHSTDTQIAIATEEVKQKELAAKIDAAGKQ